MGTLGAVYGISFVAGSLASVGSAYMASKIYPIIDEPVAEEPVAELQPVESPVMAGGDRSADLKMALAKLDAMKKAREMLLKKISIRMIL